MRSTFPRASSRRLLAAALLVLFMFLAPGDTARAAAAPDLTALDGLCFENLVQDGDQFCALRFDLPVSDGTPSTSTAWCAELEDQTGCDADPAAPTDPFSLPRGTAWVTFYTADRALLQEQVIVPRIGFGLGGVYFSPGHGLTFNDATAEICVETAGVPTFDAVVISCIPPSWNGGDDQDAARASLEVQIVSQMVTLESERLLPRGALVNGVGKITITGRPFALEALNTMDRIIPDAFQTGSGPLLTSDYTAPSGDTALQTQLGGESAASGLTAALSSVGAAFLGMSGPNTALFLLILPAGLGTAALAFVMTKSTAWAGLGLVSWLLIGMWMRAPTVSVVFTALAVLILPLAWWIVRKIS